MNQNNNIIGYDSQTGQPIYASQNINMQQPVQSQVNTQQSVQETPRKTNNKLFIIIGIFVIVGVIIGIFFFMNKDNEETVDNNLTVENSNIKNEKESDDSHNNLIEEEYSGPKQNITIVTVGHSDYEKSTLTSIITKLYGEYVTPETIMDSPEVVKNEVTYNASFVKYETENRHYSHYDMPTYEDYEKAILSGSIKIDGGILVYSITDGQTPEIHKYLKLLQQVGVSKIVVYMSKCDIVEDNELISLTEINLRELISEYGYDGEKTPIIKGTILGDIEKDKKSIQKLIESLDKWIIK